MAEYGRYVKSLWEAPWRDADAGSIPPTEDEAEFVRVAHCLVRVKEWPSP